MIKIIFAHRFLIFSCSVSIKIYYSSFLKYMPNKLLNFQKPFSVREKIQQRIFLFDVHKYTFRIKLVISISY